MREIKSFVALSKYAGERFDLVQAGGGNSSVKLGNGEMIIKASGFLLSEMEEHAGHSKVHTKQVASIVESDLVKKEEDQRKRDALASGFVREATINKGTRPSIETLLHSLLLKYTLHTHPIVVNMIVMQANWKDVLYSIFNRETIALVEYKTPGIDLALELSKTLEYFEKTPNIIFLQNHGLIVTSDNEEDIRILTERVIDKIEKHLEVDMAEFKLTNDISRIMNSLGKDKRSIAYLCQDGYLIRKLASNKNIFFTQPFCPDTLVFCGFTSVEITDLSDTLPVSSYEKRFFELPKVIVYRDSIFFIAPNIKKSKEIEEVMKFHVMVLDRVERLENNYLELEELGYLSNWEAEKFRQRI